MANLYRRWGKRALDVAASGLALIFLTPLLALIGFAVWVSMGRPILFHQERPGIGRKPFRVVKFRTMRAARPGEIWFRSDEERLTRVGRLIRKLSLDELPTLWNVLRGEMSLVGPRPLLMEYLAKYTPEQNRRHEVRPGITGWAQVNGRQIIPFSRRLELDAWYIDHWNMTQDLRILLMTVIRFFAPTDVIPGQNLDDVDDLSLSPDREARSKKLMRG
jgi:sugar transferase EpsL